MYYCACAHTNIISIVWTVFKHCTRIKLLLSIGKNRFFFFCLFIPSAFVIGQLAYYHCVRSYLWCISQPWPGGYNRGLAEYMIHTPYAQTCKKVSISRNRATSIRRGPFPWTGRLLILAIHVHKWKTTGHIVVFNVVVSPANNRFTATAHTVNWTKLFLSITAPDVYCSTRYVQSTCWL